MKGRVGRAALLTIVLGAAAGSCGPAGPRTVELTIRHSMFDPAVMEAEPDETIRFVVRNRDPIDHELIVGPMPVQRRHEVGRDAHHHGSVPGEISIPGGTTRITTYTVGTGPVPFGCHLPGHWAYGMRGVVRVG